MVPGSQLQPYCVMLGLSELSEQNISSANRTDGFPNSKNAQHCGPDSILRSCSVMAKQKSVRRYPELHRVALLAEEQNSRNAIVMDRLTNLFTRQERMEIAIGELTST